MGINQKLFEVMSETEALEKNMTVGTGSNSYKAVSEKDVLNMLKPLFKKYKLIIIPVSGDMSESNSTWEEEYNGKISVKKRNVTVLVAQFDIIDIESGEKITITGFGNGADPQDKGAGKAFTYAFKNALIKSFMLFSGEDADNTHSDDYNRPTASQGNNTPTSEVKVTVQMLEDMAKEKKVPIKQILERYAAESKKICTDVKFISQECKQKYYNELAAMKL